MPDNVLPRSLVVPSTTQEPSSQRERHWARPAGTKKPACDCGQKKNHKKTHEVGEQNMRCMNSGWGTRQPLHTSCMRPSRWDWATASQFRMAAKAAGGVGTARPLTSCNDELALLALILKTRKAKGARRWNEEGKRCTESSACILPWPRRPRCGLRDVPGERTSTHAVTRARRS